MIVRSVLPALFATGFALAAEPGDEVFNAEKAVATARSTNDTNALDRLTAEDFIWGQTRWPGHRQETASGRRKSRPAS